jgi:hypothetical protein
MRPALVGNAIVGAVGNKETRWLQFMKYDSLSLSNFSKGREERLTVPFKGQGSFSTMIRVKALLRVYLKTEEKMDVKEEDGRLDH